MAASLLWGVSPTTACPPMKNKSDDVVYDNLMLEFPRYDGIQEIKVLPFSLKKGLISREETIYGFHGGVESDILQRFLDYIEDYSVIWFEQASTDYTYTVSILERNNLRAPRKLFYAMCYNTVATFHNCLTQDDEDLRTKVRKLIKIHRKSNGLRRILN